jgi:sterol desaturase/sphingolipid hydroxylase (fatty acid hydroxylase superfamily)
VISSRLLFPAAVGVITAAALWGADSGWPLPLAFAAVLPAFYLAVALAERRWPYRRAWTRPQGDVGTDVAHLVVSGLGVFELVRLTVYGAAFAAAAWLAARTGGGLWPLHWPLLAQLALALLVAEFGHYWFHRLTHERPRLWRVHAAHHSAPRLYWLNATRFHPLDLFALLALQTAPLLVLGADERVMLAYGLFTGMYGQLQHANVALDSGPLRWLFSTPELHRWHHSRVPAEGNTNYGAVLSTWDLLFGSYFWPRDRHFTGPVGLHDLPAFPQTYLGQLASPLRWPVAADPAARDPTRPRW